MVLPIISSLASVSSSISIISTGLTGISSIIGGLGGLLSGAFTTGLVAFDNLKTNVESFFTDLKDTLDSAFNFDKLTTEMEEFLSSFGDGFKDAIKFDEIMSEADSFFSSLEGGLSNVLNFDGVMVEADSFFSSLEDKGKKAFGSIGSFLGLSSSESSAVGGTVRDEPTRGRPGGVGRRGSDDSAWGRGPSAWDYWEQMTNPTPTASYGSAQLGKDLAAMSGSARNPLAGLNDTLEGLRYLIENESGLADAINKKAGDTNVTVNVHGGGLDRRTAMNVGNIIAEEANRKMGTQQRATRYL